MLALGVDPGNSTGYGLVRLEDDKLILITAGVISENGLYDWLDEWPKYNEYKYNSEERIFVAIEDFIKRPGVANGEWLELLTAKFIGSMLYRAHQCGWRSVLQQPSCKPMGFKLAGLDYTPGKKGTHTADGISHAAYFLRNGAPSITAKKEQLRKVQYAHRQKFR